jgi:hypothetical protein
LSAAGYVVEHLDDHLIVAFVEEGEQAVVLAVADAGELVPPGAQVHLALPVEQDLGRPPTAIAHGLPQLQLGWLGAIDRLGELTGKPLDAEGVLVDADDKL